MENSNHGYNSKNTRPHTNKRSGAAQRLMEGLKSPSLKIASKSPQTQNPQSHLRIPPALRQVATAVESLSMGRFSLARDQKHQDQELTSCTRVKIYDHKCGHYSWLTLAQMDALQGQLNKWCCYCEEPLSFEHIGDKTDVQRFVELRSSGKTFFSHRNNIEGQDLTDIFDFNCLTPCKGLLYSAPFIWFLYESRPLKAFPGINSGQTCGCPCCTEKIIQETAKRS